MCDLAPASARTLPWSVGLGFNLAATAPALTLGACVDLPTSPSEAGPLKAEQIPASKVASDCKVFSLFSRDYLHHPLPVQAPMELTTVWLRNGGALRLAQDVDCPMGAEFCDMAKMRWYLYEIEFSRDGGEWQAGVYWAPNDVKLQDAFPELVQGPVCFTVPTSYDPTSASALYFFPTY